MSRYRWGILALAALVVCGLLLMPKQRSENVAYASEGGADAGQLMILDKQGQPAGFCPLKHTDVTADVAGYVARVTVKQQFANTSQEPIEALYTFPLPADAAVDDMTITLGSRTIRGEIKRREEAKQIYDAAKQAGQSAALLDQERPNIFTQSVANVMPGEQVTITISYVNLLKYDEGRYEFSFPMVVGPRYTPTGGYTIPGKRGDSAAPRGPIVPKSGVRSPQSYAPGGIEGTVHLYSAHETLPRNRRILPPGPTPPDSLPRSEGTHAIVTDPEKITPPITPPGTRVGHDISLTVNLDAGLPIQEIKSQLHPVDIIKEGQTRAVVKLKDQATIPNKDFILRFTAAGSQMQSGVLTHADGHGNGYFTLILQPPMAPPKSDIAPKEMVFVIDQTGSQSGWPIEKSKETMKYALQHMNPGDTFQLIGFNTEVYPCFPAPVPNTPANVAKALQYLEPLQGDGGTDILKSVEYALKIPDDPNRLRIICYMTDGYVGNDMQIIDYIRKNRGRARMFPFGIGNSVNRFLIEGMAKEGRGASDVVTLDEEGQGHAEKFYRRIASPVLLNPQVDWGGLPIQQVFPEQIPDVFTAGPILIKGRYTRPAQGDIVVRGILRGRPWSQRLHVILPAMDKDGAAISTIWAREKIEDLQSQDWLGAQNGQPDASTKEQIVQTALEHRLMSQYTSFVAVEQQIVNIGGRQKTVDVPVEMPEGVSYSGIFGDAEEKQVMAQQGFGGSVSRGRGVNYLFKSSAPRQLSESLSYNAPAGASNGLASQPAAPATVPLLRTEEEAPTVSSGTKTESRQPSITDALLDDKDIRSGSKESETKLQALKPEQRKAVLVQAKLDPALQALVQKAGSTKPKAGSKPEEVAVQVWLNRLPPDGLKRLKALGFKPAATLRQGKLLLGTLPVQKLEALVELSFVSRVEPPKFR